VVLVLGDDVTASVLVALVAFASLLRARLFPAVRQRLSLLVTGLVGVAALGIGSTQLAPAVQVAVVVPVLVAAAALVISAGLVYSTRAPSPYLGRVADILDVLFVIAVVPVACGVLGLYGAIRGING
jgi:heme A synthase